MKPDDKKKTIEATKILPVFLLSTPIITTLISSVDSPAYSWGITVIPEKMEKKMNTLLTPIDENSVNYERDKHIDMNNLHEEWLRQPSLMGDYVKLLTQAEKDRSKAKEYLELCKTNLVEAKARLEEIIRLDPENYNPPINKKGEVDTKEAWYTLKITLESKNDPDCIKAVEELSKAQKELIEAEYKVGCYNAGVKAMIDKKASLEHEVFLWARSYLSVPNLPRSLIEDYQDARKIEQDEVVTKVRQEVQPAEFKEFDPSQRRRRKS